VASAKTGGFAKNRDALYLEYFVMNLNHMDEQVRGHRVETCFGADGCPNRACNGRNPASRLEDLLTRKNILGFMKQRVAEPLKMHHELRVSISDCPNACSRPQIADIGLIGACRPSLSRESCSRCGSCLELCRENAIMLTDGEAQPAIDPGRCLACGLCANACPSGKLIAGAKGYRILLGGKLGRHPQLAKEIKGIFSPEECLVIVETCVDHFMKHYIAGERFGDILNQAALYDLPPPRSDS
jgi:dissimilatory sulfite reductase (desulfoviridin) alpha/beta subunit